MKPLFGELALNEWVYLRYWTPLDAIVVSTAYAVMVEVVDSTWVTVWISVAVSVSVVVLWICQSHSMTGHKFALTL